jgi:WD40 repeat protein
MLTGEVKPKMPPGGALDLETIGTIRRWIDEGAKVDSMAAAPAPSAAAAAGKRFLPRHVETAAPVTALAYSPDGRLLAVGGYRSVRLLDAATGELARTISGPADQVQSVAWSADGALLAVGGGVPGEAGEALIVDVASGRVAGKLIGHAEVVYSVAWRPGGREIATGSLDKTARVWNAVDGTLLRTIKDHVDAVFGVAWSPDGTLLATGSADRSVKLFDTATWKVVQALSTHQDAVTSLAFSRDGLMLATTGADKQMHVWNVKPGQMENPARKQYAGDIISACAFSQDGSYLVYGTHHAEVKVFNAEGSQFRRDWKDAKEWICRIAIAPDSRAVAAGTMDGRVLVWSLESNKLLRTIHLEPKAVRVSAPEGGK